jgi:hypothetical protein
VFENRALRIFGPRREEVTGEWRKLHNEDLNDLYFSPNIRVIKSRMRWAGHVARMGEGSGAYKIWWEKLRERGRLEDPGVDGSILLRSSESDMEGHGLD